MTLVDQRARSLQEYPDWTVHQSEAGRWWAHRTSTLPATAFKAGCRMTLDADDFASLTQLLEDQAARTAAVPVA
jgi:hypothetical protein